MWEISEDRRYLILISEAQLEENPRTIVYYLYYYIAFGVTDFDFLKFHSISTFISFFQHTKCFIKLTFLNLKLNFFDII